MSGDAPATQSCGWNSPFPRAAVPGLCPPKERHNGSISSEGDREGKLYTRSWSTAPPRLLCHSQPSIQHSHGIHAPGLHFPAPCPQVPFHTGKDGSALQLLPFPVSCSIELPGCTAHSQRIVNSQRIKNGRNLPSSGRGALQAGCLLLQSMLDTSQGLSPELRMSRGCHGMQAHFAQHREFQLRAVIIPKQIKGGKFVEGEVT